MCGRWPGEELQERGQGQSMEDEPRDLEEQSDVQQGFSMEYKLEMQVSRAPGREAGSGLINLGEKCGFLIQKYTHILYIHIHNAYMVEFPNFYEILDCLFLCNKIHI